MSPARLLCSAAARLLHYPDETFAATLRAVRDELAAAPRSRDRAALLAFVGGREAQPPAGLQETYVHTFDFNPRTSLHLTAHTFGEEKERAATPQRGFALAQLGAVYAAHGLELEGGEMPDFLPALLEFVSEAGCPPDLAPYLPPLLRAVELLQAHLAERGSDYAPVVAVARSALGAAARRGRRGA